MIGNIITRLMLNWTEIRRSFLLAIIEFSLFLAACWDTTSGNLSKLMLRTKISMKGDVLTSNVNVRKIEGLIFHTLSIYRYSIGSFVLSQCTSLTEKNRISTAMTQYRTTKVSSDREIDNGTRVDIVSSHASSLWRHTWWHEEPVSICAGFPISKQPSWLCR